jgi:hypothetical protein
MSDSMAIAAVTSALRRRLQRALDASLPGTRVTLRPPDKARDGQAGNQVNLFLFRAAPNASWRNVATGPPGAGGPRQPPLALDLLYLMSAHGRDDDDAEPFSHRLLGEAMRALHEQPVLEPAELAPATAGSVAERVRVTLQPLSLEEMTKLWTIFQAPYRLSVVYEATVVLIDRAPEGTGHGG